MFLLGIVMAAVGLVDGQVLAGLAFEALARRTDAVCQAERVRAITPGDLDGVQESFVASLSRRDRLRLSSANTADRRCAGRDGLTCPTIATLDAMRKVQLLPRFAAYICTLPGSH